VNDQTDAQLLRAYAEHGSEASFRELVHRHLDLVHSAAVRMVHDPHLAQDVSQGVFVVLAKNAARLTDRPVLAGWLHRTAKNIAAQTVRTSVRRQRREQEAAAMNELLSGPDASWEDIAPNLDAALDGLSESDRDAILLRYFERKSAGEMAAALGISDEAAQKRVSRAVEKLRDFLSNRGLRVGASGLVIVISANAVQAAPAGLAVVIASTALSSTVAATTGVIAVAKSATLTTLEKTLIAATVAGLGGLVLTATLMLTEKPRGGTTSGSPTPAVAPVAEVEKNTLSDPPSTILPRTYAIEDIAPPPGFISSRVTSLNNQGQAVGWLDGSNGVVHAFFWADGVLTDLGTLGGSKAIACSINDLGEIAAVVLTNEERRVFLLQTNAATDLGAIDGFAKLGTEGNISYVPSVSLNNRSEVTGRLMVAGDNQRSFLSREGRISYFGLRGDGSILAPRAMNNRGVIAGVSIPGEEGWGAFLWTDGKLTDLKTLGGPRAGVNAINNLGTVVGWANSIGAAWDQAHAIVWEKGALHDLNTANWKSSHATGINNAGNIVGDATTLSGRTFAFLKRGDDILDLNDLVPTNSGWRLVGASAINDREQILAIARKDGRNFPVLVSPEDLPRNPAPKPMLVSHPVPASTAAAPLNITSFERLPDGAFRLAFNGQPGVQYAIEASTNLTTWILLGEAINRDGQLEFVDRDAPKFTLRFYRIAQP
jgi:RNA polymerase sigma factor (sigma-70 family)